MPVALGGTVGDSDGEAAACPSPDMGCTTGPFPVPGWPVAVECLVGAFAAPGFPGVPVVAPGGMAGDTRDDVPPGDTARPPPLLGACCTTGPLPVTC
ncbi:predicted protein [Streptomyces viridochromogenes DSM 40736]|uniref:Predicted protein n=1 Tax=Streptomyces viridochromogenes (strain DSM 40736 / JCM 4977 / BCRC 1201 / Tue 494) TaxID=591159 RepID=D9XJ67_STRVT|nr:predicted protein [Streptomyces viridochromogenes DSM 40736]